MSLPASSINYCEIVMHGLITAAGSTSKNTVNVFHFRRTSTINVLVKSDIETAFNTSIAAKILLALNARWAQTETSVRYIEDATDAPSYFTRSGPGAITGDSFSTLLTAYILMRTALRGRSYRGSKHLGPLSESDTTTGSDDILNSGALGRFNTIATTILGGFTDADGNVWVPSIVSKNLSQLKVNPTTLIANDVTGVSVNKRIGRLRRRAVKSVY